MLLLVRYTNRLLLIIKTMTFKKVFISYFEKIKLNFSQLIFIRISNIHIYQKALWADIQTYRLIADEKIVFIPNLFLY